VGGGGGGGGFFWGVGLGGLGHKNPVNSKKGLGRNISPFKDVGWKNRWPEKKKKKYSHREGKRGRKNSKSLTNVS